MGSLAGAWIAVVAGLGGMRTDRHGLHFAPRLPDRIGRLSFRLCYRGRRLNVAVSSDTATYQLVSGEEMPITHHRRELHLGATPVEAPIPPIVAGPTPTQPPGRRPIPRRER
jgi:alpha,alpha-trehalose phosphorylase